MDKKGFLRIVEASVAILIIAGVLFLFFTNSSAQTEPNLSEMARDILEEMSKNTSLRENIINSEDGNVIDFVNSRVPGYLEFELRICGIGGACGIEYIPGNVYSAERIISSTINTPGPKKVRLFIWEAT